VGGEVKGRMGGNKYEMGAGHQGFLRGKRDQLPPPIDSTPQHKVSTLFCSTLPGVLDCKLLYWSKSCPYSCLLIEVVMLSVLTVGLS